MLIPFKLLRFTKFKGIIHVGAHEAEELNDYLERDIEDIIWIEPIPEKIKFLKNKLANYKKMIIGEFAAGESESIVKFNIANNYQSSSVLDLGTHKESYPWCDYVSVINVPVKSIDKWINSLSIRNEQFDFVNLDLQGYELQALKGMSNQLHFIKVVYCEVFFQEVYKNNTLVHEVDRFLSTYGFKRVATSKCKEGWGDAVYVKKNKIFYTIFLGLYIIVINILWENTKQFFISLRYKFGIFRKNLRERF